MSAFPRISPRFCATLAIILLLAASIFSFPSPDQVQAATSTITIRTTQASAYEGGLATFILERYGGGTAPLMVEVETWEPNAEVGGSNDTELTHEIQFPRGVRRALLHAVPFTDTNASESDPHTLNAQVMAPEDGSYQVGDQNSASISILEQPSDNSMPVVRVQRGERSVTEGEDISFTFTRTGGDTTQPFTIDIQVHDAGNLLRGDYWDAPTVIPSQVEFGAGSTSETVTLSTPDDERDLVSDNVTLDIVPSRDYLLRYFRDDVIDLGSEPVYVNDNDTAPNLTLLFGKDGDNDVDVAEGDTLKVKLRRRQQDVDNGADARVTVRVETTRKANKDNTLEGWQTDYSYDPDRLYKDFELELTGTDREVEESLLVPENGVGENDWKYWARVMPILDYEGNEVSGGQAAEYWTFKPNFRGTEIDATDNGDMTGTVTLTTDQASVYEGGGVTYTLTRTGGAIGAQRPVVLETNEPNRDESNDSNCRKQTHSPTFPAWVESITYIVTACVDGVTEEGTDTLKAKVLANSFYTPGTPNSVEVEINDPPADSTFITITGSPTNIAEGETSTITFTRTGGDTTQELTINVEVDDQAEHLRGNHWDPAPDLNAPVTFQPNATQATRTLTAVDDQREVSVSRVIVVSVLPGEGYLLGQDGTHTQYAIAVTDNDDPQVLSLDLGYMDPSIDAWEDGESWFGCNGDDCSPGPAEGTYYYEDNRDHRIADEFAEPWPIHFEVSRRGTDTGSTATFVVRVEHNRGWIGPRHADWLIDPETGNYYKDFPLTLTGNQRKVVGRIEVTNNGLNDRRRWTYTASIRRLEDVNGVPLSADSESKYWTVNGNRNQTVALDNERGLTEFNIMLPDPASVAEGSDITLTIERMRGHPYADLPVQIRTWEPSQTNPDGTNPTEQVHNLVFPGVPVTSLFQRDLTQTIDLAVTAVDDTDFEPNDLLKFQMISPRKYHRDSVVSGQVTILDDDQPTITLTADETSITEGETVTFTLTRGNNTDVETLVSVSVDDPGKFLQGDYVGDPDGVETPTSVMFAAGEATKTVAITPPDDRRDIADSTLTFTVDADPGYEIQGTNPRTVQVADNDVAPQVQIAFNHDQVNEGEDLVMTVSRIGEDKNDLEIPLTGGRTDDQQFMVVGMDPGQSEATFRYTLPEDEVKGPDAEYRFTLHPGDPEFWVPTGDTTVTGKIVDEDPYRVSVRMFRARVNEGETIYYRLEHDGYTDESLQVKVEHSEEGSAVADGIIKEYTHTIPAGSSGLTRGFESEAADGSDGDATFTVELVENDAYEIVAERASADMIVVDKDPLPVLQWENTRIDVSEADGTVEHVIELVSDLPVLRDVTLEYQVQEQFASDGADINIADTAMTLTIPAGETSGTIEIPVIQDLEAESDETVYVYVRNPVNATLQDGVSFLLGWVVIEDDEPVVSLEAAQDAVNEGDDIVLNLTRTGETTNELVVWLNIEQDRGTATLDNPQVTFATGSDTATYTLETVDDDRSRGSYEVRASVASPGNLDQDETYHADPDRTTVTVRDDDLPKVSIYTDGLRVTEGESISFTVARRYTGGRPLTVNLDVNETGSYTTGTIPTTATIPAGKFDVEVEIQTEDDSVSEDTGELVVSIGTGTRYVSAYPSSVAFGIFDNDSTLPQVLVEGDDEWVNEGTDVSFTFTRTGSLTDSLDARVRLYRTRSRATAAELADTTREITSPRDLIYLNEEEITVTFPADSATVTVSRSTIDDTLNYGNSSYHAYVHSGPDDVYASRNSWIAQVWVQDDDRPEVSLSLVDDAYYTHSISPHPDVLRFRSEGLRVYFSVERTGDTTGQLPVIVDTSRVTFKPAPLEDDEAFEIGDDIFPTIIPPGESSIENGLTVQRYVNSLGRERSYLLKDPHYCPDEPAVCGYGPQYTLGTPEEITIPIYATFMGVGIAADQATVAEGGSATFTFHRQGGKPDALSRPLEVKIAVTQDGDYISGSTVDKVTFLANESTATVTVNTENDIVDEADGAITITILAPDSFDDDEKAYETRQYPVTPWSNYTVSTPVTDDDYVPPNVSVDDAIGKEQDEAIEFTISLDAANNEEAATVNWATAEDGTDDAATSDTDYTAASGTVTFAIGETEKTVTVTLLDDEIDEAHETFNLVLSSPHGATIDDGTAVGTILDDELATAVIFDSPVGDVEEGDNVSLRVKRLPLLEPGDTVSTDDPCYTSGLQTNCFNFSPTAEDLPDALTIKVRVTEEGDVISGTAPTTVTFEAGSAYGFLEIPTEDDTTIEADGQVTVQVLNGSGYSPLFLGSAETPEDNLPTNRRTVYDNDLTVSISDASATEGTDSTLDFTVRLNAAAPQEYTVDVATSDGDATSHGNVTLTSLGKDFTATTQTITFAEGVQTQTFSVPIDDDTIQERGETFTAALSNPQGYSQLDDASATGTIIDDEEPLVASVSRTYGVVDEDQADPARFMVTLSHPDTTNHERNPAAAWQTVDGTATGDEDYVTASGSVDFGPGQMSGFFDVEIEDDNLVEATLETFTVELVAADSRLVTLSPTEGSFDASIRDNETLTASVVANQENVVEGQDAVFTVRLAGGVTTEDTSVTFELTEGVADEVYVDTGDYGAPIGNLSLPSNNKSGESGAVIIPAGESSGVIIYPISEDNTEENDGEGERMELRIFSANDGLATRAISTTEYKAFTTILDKGTLTASIEGTPTVTEGGTATFTVSLSTTADEAVSVGWATTQTGETFGFGETAVPDADYTANSGTVAIQPGDTSGTFTVQTTDDVLVEDSESFLVHLEDATKGSGTPAELLPLGTLFTVGTIRDNDVAPDGVTISATPLMVNENSGATDIAVTVSLDGTSQFTTDTPVTLQVIGLTATADEDYTADNVDIVIPAGQSSVTATVTLTLIDDNLLEENETIRISAVPADLANSAQLTITILDNDLAPGELEVGILPVEGDESDGTIALEVNAVLNGQTTLPVDVEVELTTRGITATAGDDFETATSTITIPAGSRSAKDTLDLTVLEDTLDEKDETLEVTGTVANAGSLNLPPSFAVKPVAPFTIVDNDAAPTAIGLSVTGNAVTEGGSSVNLTVRATLFGGGTRLEATTVALELVDITATVTDDYTVGGALPTITIPAGSFYGEATVAITPVQDSLYEGTEAIALRGSNADPGLSVSGVRLAIEDDDPAPTTVALSFSKGSVSESEQSTFQDLFAELEGSSTLTQDLRVNPSSLKGSGNAVRSANGNVTGNLIIEAGESSATAPIFISGLDDDEDDGDETLRIEGSTDNPDISVTPARLTITDDDTAGLETSVGKLIVPEGTSRTYQVRLKTRPTANVTVTLSVPANASFTATPGTLTFKPGNWSTWQTVTVTASTDLNADDDPARNISHSTGGADSKYGSLTALSLPVTVRDNTSASITVNPDKLTVTEGSTGTYTVVLGMQPTGDVTVAITGTTDTDVSVGDDELTFTDQNWSTAQTVTVTAGQDSDSTDDTVTLTHTASGGGYSNASTVDVVVTVDDIPAVTVEYGAATYSVEESDDSTTTEDKENEVVVTVKLSADPERRVIIPIVKTNQGGASSSDYSGVPDNVTFDSGDTSKTFTFTATADTTDDDNEKVKLTFGTTLPTGVTEGSTKQTIISINDDDLPADVDVEFDKSAYSVAEGSSETIKVLLSEEPERSVTVYFIITDIGNVRSSDYSGVPRSVTFGATDTEKSFTFSATADDIDDDGDQVKLSFSTLPSGISEGAKKETTISIIDDDDPAVKVEFGAATYSVEESDDSTTTETKENEVVVTVTLSEDPERTVIIPITKTNQGGASSSDYSGVPDNVTFDSGDTSKTFTFTAESDTTDDDGEKVKLTFGTTLPTGVTEGTTKQTIISINDDDDPAVTVEFGAATYSVDESDDSTTTETKENEVVVTVTLSADPERTVVIPIVKTNQGGASSSDYSGVPDNVTFDSGDTSKTFTFTATADTTDDDNEKVKLTFGTTLPTWVTEGSTKQTIISINDDDLPADVDVEFDKSAYSVAEGSSETIKVLLSEEPERSVTVYFIITDIGNVRSSDYSGVPRSVTFGATDTEKSFTFSATADDIDDDGDQVKLSFSTLPSGISEGAKKETTISIIDGDDPAVTVEFGSATYSVDESDDSTTTETKENEVVVTVTLSEDPERTVVIPIVKTNQGGASSSDYSGVPDNVTFDSGDTSKTFTFTAESDTTDDDNEKVKLTFGTTLPTGVTEGTTKQTIISITDDDDPAVKVEFGSATYSVDESDDSTTTEDKENEVVVTVTLSADPERTVVIPIVKTNQGGASSSDYSGVPDNVTFDSGDTSKTFTFTATADTTDDDNEKVKLTFGTTLPTGVTEGTTKQTIISINDDDDPGVKVEFGAATYSVDESDDSTTTETKENEVVVTVKLSADPERTVVIPIVKTNQGGASSSDYSGVPANITFNSGDTSKTFTFTAESDTTDDDGEKVKLTFGTTLPTGVTEGTTKQTIISINDDDDPAVKVEFGAATYSVEESDDSTTTETKENEVVVTVKLSADPERTVVIPIVKTNQGGASSSDYSGVPANITFNSGDTSKTFTFTAESDTTDDDGEKVKLTFGTTLPTSVTEGTTKQTIISINDDDDPAVKVEFGAATYSVEESDDSTTTETKENEVVVTVTLSADPERTVVIPVVKTNQGGASSSDYSGVPANVTFNSGDTSKTFTFTAESDTTDDDNEKVKLTFGTTLPTGVTEGTTKQTIISINDDDDPEVVQRLTSVSVSYKASAYSLSEGDNVSVEIKLSDDPERTVVIPVSATGGTGVTDSDYSGVPANVTFNSGDTSKTFTFTAESDQDDEDEETVTLAFGELPDGVSAGTIASATVYIRDSLRVSFGAAEYEAHEGGNNATVTVKLDSAAIRKTVIPLDAAGIDGATSDDWSGVPDELTFEAGDSSKVFTVAAVDDTVEDDDEGVRLTFGTLPAGVVEGSPSTATVVLMNMELTKGHTECPEDNGERIILDSRGEITQAGKSQYWRISLDPYRVYLVELFGTGSNRDVADSDLPSETLTLSDPRMTGFYSDDKSMMFTHSMVGHRLDLIRGTTTTGWHRIEVSGNGETGTYRIRARVNNVCTKNNGLARYPYFGGPDGYVLDIHAGASTDRVLNVQSESAGGILGDNWSWYWDSEPDVDWFKVPSLKETTAYDIEVWADDEFPSADQATDLKIVGVYDDEGDLISDTASSSTGRRVSTSFEPGADGTYYVAVGSGSSDRTGLYKIKIVADDESGNGSGGQNDSNQNNRRSVEEPEGKESKINNGNEGTEDEPERANNPATGRPVISGEARVGQTLTASTSGIRDQDGLENVSFAYQWRAGGSDISGANDASYTLTTDELGDTITVQVSFTDDGGNAESRVSTATAAVTAENPPPKPTNLQATKNDDGSVTLSWDAPNDDTVTGYLILRRLPQMGEDAMQVYVADTGSTATSYTDTSVTPGTRHVYRVKAINPTGVGSASKAARIDP